MKGFATKRTAVGQQRLTSGERILIYTDEALAQFSDVVVCITLLIGSLHL